MNRWILVVPLIALALAGCLGSTLPPVSRATASETDPEDGSAGLNLTIEVVNASARWMLEPFEDPTNPGAVKVTVWLNGSLTRGEDPVANRTIDGEANLTSREPWTSCSGTCVPSPIAKRREAYEARTGSDGNVSVKLGPFDFDVSPIPPVGEPYCENVWIWSVGNASADGTTVRDTDRFTRRVCTQSYP